MATRVDCARMLVYRAAAAKMAGLPYTRESAQEAKLYAAEAATYVTQKPSNYMAVWVTPNPILLNV